MKKIKKPLSYSELPDIPKGILRDYSVEIFSDSEILICGDGQISELSDAVLKVTIHEHELTIQGENLNISDYTEENIIITGKLKAVFFGKDEKI